MVDRGRIELPTPGFSVPCSRRVCGTPWYSPRGQLGAGGPEPGARLEGPRGCRSAEHRDLQRGRHPFHTGRSLPPSTLRVPQRPVGLRAGPTSLRISLRSPITTQLTPSHPILEDPGRQRRETHAGTGVVAAELVDGAPGGTRTPDPRLRRPLLYPTELQARSGILATCGAPVKRRGPRVPRIVPVTHGHTGGGCLQVLGRHDIGSGRIRPAR